MDWPQALTILGSLAGTIVWITRQQREDQRRMDDRHREDIARLDNSVQKTNDHWRELFKYFNERLDKK